MVIDDTVYTKSERGKVMKDNSLDKFLVGLIGIPGLTICVIAWIEPMDISERILTIAIGAVGFIWALFRSLSLRSMKPVDHSDST